jgi:hypothetical protein
LRGLDSAFGLLLKRIHHPHVVADLHGINRSKGVVSMLQRDFEYAAINAAR